MGAEDKNWDALVDQAATAFGGSVDKMVTGIRIRRADGQACSLYYARNLPEHRYELAVSIETVVGGYSPALIVAWLQREIAASGRRGAQHKGVASWPTIGFVDYDSAKDFLDCIWRLRAERFNPHRMGLRSTDVERGPEPNASISVQRGANELAGKSAISSAVAELLAEYRAPVSDLPDTTEVFREVRQRIGQAVLRRRLLKIHHGQCQVTGLALEELLRVSHIKPWAQATDEERLNPANALLLAPHLDAAFDRKLVTFDETGTMLLSSRLSSASRQCLGFTAGALRNRPTEEQQAFLTLHREQFRLTEAGARHSDRV
ncbi:putative restriction endonuclease [Paraburkholderia kururiensis]|uniref:HNH endonuclease n=1 Tax=Paraburkholderia kururiensis TaxID=984307 RepID=UPI0039A61625